MGRVAVEIRVAVPDDLSAIVSLASTRLPVFAQDLEFSKRYFRWKYFDLEGRETGYPVGFVAEDGDGITGFVGCLPFTLRGGDWSTAAGWIADWSLASRARGRGLGRALLASARETIPALGCVDGSADAQALFLAQGFRWWDCGRSWVWIARPLAYEWPCRVGWRRPVGLVRAAGHARRRATRRRRVAGVELRECSWGEIGESLDLAAAEWGAGRPRAYLEWLGRSPAADVRVHRFCYDGREVGGALTHRDRDLLGRRRARILELTVQGGPELLAAAYAALARTVVQTDRADYVDLVAPRGHDTALQSCGFAPRSFRRLWLATSNGAAPSAPAWRLSLVDKDDAFRGNWRVP